jgi:hypothetical protein
MTEIEAISVCRYFAYPALKSAQKFMRDSVEAYVSIALEVAARRSAMK